MSSSKKPLLGNHQKCWIWGKHAVLETLKRGRWIPYEVVRIPHLQVELRQEIETYCERLNVPILEGTRAQLEKLCRHEDHQGLIAQMPPFPYTELTELSRLKKNRQVCIYLDGIQDPHNLGAIIRSADVLGIDAVLIPANGQVGVTNMVVKSSAGAVNAVPIIKLEEPLLELARFRAQGYQLIGLAGQGTVELQNMTWPAKSVLMLGNEAEGLKQEIIAVCDQLVKITVHGIVDSLNVAVTAGIVMYEAMRKQGPIHVAPK